jgi:hypothetical protein
MVVPATAHRTFFDHNRPRPVAPLPLDLLALIVSFCWNVAFEQAASSGRGHQHFATRCRRTDAQGYSKGQVARGISGRGREPDVAGARVVCHRQPEGVSVLRRPIAEGARRTTGDLLHGGLRSPTLRSFDTGVRTPWIAACLRRWPRRFAVMGAIRRSTSSRSLCNI